MRWSAPVVVVLVGVFLAGCSNAVPSPPPELRSPSPRPSFGIDARFEMPILCRANASYNAVAAAMGAGDVPAMHRAAAAAVGVFVTAGEEERDHAWGARARPYVAAYTAEDDAAVTYYRAVARASTIADAVDLTDPNDETLNLRMAKAIGIPADFTCPAS